MKGSLMKLNRVSIFSGEGQFVLIRNISVFENLDYRKAQISTTASVS
jgi:hypothetical protein